MSCHVQRPRDVNLMACRLDLAHEAVLGGLWGL